jgi:hypothetical protein
MLMRLAYILGRVVAHPDITRSSNLNFGQFVLRRD